MLRMTVASALASALGTYFGSGDGDESGPPGRLSYAWWWGESGFISEQSRAEVALPAEG
jgi:hypothetical protein